MAAKPLSDKEITRLSGRLKVTEDQVRASALPDDSLRRIYKRAGKNSRGRFKLGLACLFSAYSFVAGADNAEKLADEPIVQQVIDIYKQNPSTVKIGEFYENTLRSPDLPFYIRATAGGQIALCLVMLPFNLRRRRKLGEELTGAEAASTAQASPAAP